jgi:hypothetical protein
VAKNLIVGLYGSCGKQDDTFQNIEPFEQTLTS